MNKLGTEVC